MVAFTKRNRCVTLSCKDSHTHTQNTHTQSPCTAEDRVVKLTANKKVEREWDDG